MVPRGTTPANRPYAADPSCFFTALIERGSAPSLFGIEDAAGVLPEAIRLVLLRVRVPRYQRDMLVALAQRHGVSIDEIVTRELEDVACAHAEELADVVPSLAIGLGFGAAGAAG